MATIEDLDKISISEMSYDELVNILMEIRKSRRTPHNKSTKSTKKTKSKSINININDMDVESAMKLLEKLEEKLK